MTTNIPDDVITPLRGAEDMGKSVIILTADGVEDLELLYPCYRLIEAGCKVDVFSPTGGEVKGKNGYKFNLTEKIPLADVQVYDLLYIPGGKAPDALKDDKDAVAFVQKFAASGKPIAAFCHGPQVLAEADVIRGCTISAWPEIENEVRDAGAIYKSVDALVDGQFITGRWPADLPAFMPRVLEALMEGLESRSSHGAMPEQRV
jgi:protease I